MIELLRITAEYSNAVLVAIMPLVANFATNLDLPGTISTNSLVRFQCDPRVGHVGGKLLFTNEHEFWFEQGRVMGFRTAHTYDELQDPSQIPEFVGNMTITEAEALELARKKLQAASVSLPQVYADQPPTVTGPTVLQGKTVPHLIFEWLDPLSQGRSAMVEVNAEKKRIEKLRFFTRQVWKDPPRIGITPEPLRPSALAIKWSATESNATLTRLLRLAPDYIKRMSLAMAAPVAADVQNVTRRDGAWEYAFRLKSGYTLLFVGEEAVGHIAPRCLFLNQHAADAGRPAKDYIGVWKLSEAEAIAKGRAAVQKEAARTSLLLKGQPQVTKAKSAGIYTIPRFFLIWSHSETNTRAEVEVDASDGTIRYLFVFAAMPQ